MSKKKETEMVYEVIILRRTTHIVALQSSDYKVCMKLWEELQKQWVDAVKEVKPFVLKSPIVSAFEPGLIYEINILPVVEQPTTMSDNPYQRQMVQNGLGAMGPRDLL